MALFITPSELPRVPNVTSWVGMWRFEEASLNMVVRVVVNRLYLINTPYGAQNLSHRSSTGRITVCVGCICIREV